MRTNPGNYREKLSHRVHPFYAEHMKMAPHIVNIYRDRYMCKINLISSKVPPSYCSQKAINTLTLQKNVSTRYDTYK